MGLAYKGLVRQLTVAVAFVFMVAVNVITHIEGILPYTESDFASNYDNFINPKFWAYHVLLLNFYFSDFFIVNRFGF
jgi:hypothetical protein